MKHARYSNQPITIKDLGIWFILIAVLMGSEFTFASFKPTNDIHRAKKAYTVGRPTRQQLRQAFPLTPTQNQVIKFQRMNSVNLNLLYDRQKDIKQILSALNRLNPKTDVQITTDQDLVLGQILKNYFLTKIDTPRTRIVPTRSIIGDVKISPSVQLVWISQQSQGLYFRAHLLPNEIQTLKGHLLDELRRTTIALQFKERL